MHESTRSPHRVAECDDPADELLRLACLTYGADDPSRLQSARTMLAGAPGLAKASIHTMAVTGAVDAARAVLAADPTAARRDGGPFRWPPLLYAAYSRLDLGDRDADVVAVARLLLDHGADANAGYLWEGYAPPFTTLTGAFGGGEGGQPAHRSWRALAELLLAAGADANDGQTIYNRGLGDRPSDDTEYLELLFQHGLGRGDGGPWRRRLAEQHEPADLVAEVLQHAAEMGLPARARLVLAQGADPNRRARHPIFGGRTPYESAMRGGNLDVAAMLVEVGADTSTLDDVQRLVSALVAGDESARLAAPALLEQARRREPALVDIAAERGRVGAIRLLVQLGWDVNARRRGTALHTAAMSGDAALARALLALGADPTIRDTEFGGTPAGWAHHGGHLELAEELAAAERR